MAQQELLKTLLASLNSRQLLRELIHHLQSEQHLELEQVVQMYQEASSELSIPLSIFSHKLPPAGALCKFLHEAHHFSFGEIAEQLNRDRKSVWATYQRARKRMRAPLEKVKSPPEAYLLPISLFHDRSHSILEQTIQYLRQTYHLTNPQIAKLLHKSPNSIAVLAKRARDKRGGTPPKGLKGLKGLKRDT